MSPQDFNMYEFVRKPPDVTTRPFAGQVNAMVTRPRHDVAWGIVRRSLMGEFCRALEKRMERCTSRSSVLFVKGEGHRAS
jgi:hypothetical protein